MFETYFSENNIIWVYKKDLRVTSPECPTKSADLGRTVARKSSIAGLHVCARGLDILKILFLIHNMNNICWLCKLIVNIFPQILIIGS